MHSSGIIKIWNSTSFDEFVSSDKVVTSTGYNNGWIKAYLITESSPLPCTFFDEPVEFSLKDLDLAEEEKSVTSVKSMYASEIKTV